jgi:hypothetical protein
MLSVGRNVPLIVDPSVKRICGDVSFVFFLWDGGMEGWRDGGMEGWREKERERGITCTTASVYVFGWAG